MTTYSFEPVEVPTLEEAQQRAAGSADPPPDPASAAPPELPELPAGPEITPPPPASAGPPERNAEGLEAERLAAHERGFEEGRRAEAERVRTLVGAVNAVLEELNAADARRRDEAQHRIAALATAIAGHLIEREVRTTPELVSDLVRRAVAEFPVTESLVVHLNPSDLALPSAGAGDAGRGSLTSGHSVRWTPDPALRSGGCLVEGVDRVVDARLGHILERIFRALTDA